MHLYRDSLCYSYICNVNIIKIQLSAVFYSDPAHIFKMLRLLEIVLNFVFEEDVKYLLLRSSETRSRDKIRK
jgi:hypothetical protein